MEKPCCNILFLKHTTMAEMIENAPQGKRKRLSTKVDLTPMVDLGFLLITFFVFTSQMSAPKAMRFFAPADGVDMETPESGAVTLIPDENAIWYYEGNMPHSKAEMQRFSYNDKNELRSKLIHLKTALIKSNGNDNKLMVMIKPSAASNFGYVVDMLDEMIICDVKRYAVVDIDPQEDKLISEL
jgi:biopolymer transport protein ExbD